VAVVAMNAIVILRNQLVAWYNYAVVIVLLPIGLFVFYRIFLRYKVLKFGNNQIEVIYPVLRKTKTYTLNLVDQWMENKVKTGKNSEYKELLLKFSDGQKITIGHKEHTEYSRLVQYLAQKVPKKKAPLS
jgi:hypothetical protein